MRVVGGKARGRRLQAPKGLATRPTSDRVREATFNALESINALRDAVVLDLFAGTGAMGIEALSRGATAATFVDDDRAAVATVKANLAATGFEGRVVNGDVIHHLRTGGRAGATLVLVDPPYSFDQWDELLALIHDAEVAVAVLESDREIDPGEAWRVRRSKRYGGTVVTIASPAENRFFG